ncbi:C40 family peptidase [Rhabdothermincola sp.]|uniref:C40 family peptidase n=1 Tax=Rhabdothermincola sp. TaxID=2820405 RepID=UPI002FE23D7F
MILALVVGAIVAPGSASADQLADKRAEAQRVAAKLDALEARVMQLDEAAERAKGELAAAEAAVADAQRRADEANAELEQRRSELRAFAVEAYVSGNDGPAVDALLASTTDEAPKVRGYLEITTGSRQDLVDQLQATRKRAEDEGRQLSEAQQALADRHAQLQASLDEAQAAVDEQAAIKSKLDGEIAQLVREEQERKAAEARQRAEEQARQQAAQRSAGTRASQPSPAGGPPPRTAPTAPGPAIDDSPPPAVGSGAAAAVAAGMSKIGAPYVWAAAGPNAFDCSGFTMWAWAQGGKSLPHYSGAQYAMSRRISQAEAQPGDLVFFWGPGESGDPGHVGLYIGGGQMVHAPGRGKFVRVDSVGYWSGARVAFGRV